MRIVFMGTPDFAVPTLAGIIAGGHEVAAVYTQPPRRSGRGMREQPGPVHRFAASAGLDVRFPTSLKDAEAVAQFADLNADLAVVVAYGLLLPAPVLAAPRHGCLNLHASLLPRWRGAAPIQRAIMAGDEETGVMVMRMEEGLDTGPVCLSDRVPIGEAMTAGELHDVLADRGAALMVRALAALEGGGLQCTPQGSDGVTYANKIDKSEARIDFMQDAATVHNQIRALSPFPGAWFEMPVGARRERIKVLRSKVVEGRGQPGALLDTSLTVACADGAVELLELQRAGRSPMDAASFLRGVKMAPGLVLQ